MTANVKTATGWGDLVFWGDQNRRFRAFDAEDGKVLWEAIVAGIGHE